MRHLFRLMLVLAALCLLPVSVRADSLPNLDGDWIVGEIDGSDYDLFMSFNRSQGTMQPRPMANSPTPSPRQLTLDRSKAPFYTVTIAEGNDPFVTHSRILLQTPNDTICWIEGRPHLLRLRRLTKNPVEALRGPWQIGGAMGNDPRHLTLDDSSVTFTMPDGSKKVAAVYQVYSKDRPTVDLVIAPPAGVANLIHFQPVPDGSFITWGAERGSYHVLYRAGQKPAWLTEDAPASTTPAP